ncbi:MAG: hypothetical protein HQM12_16545 [SAR324 cluster bacterium]|nr:hypothetical protein [SAR324 cluster bacterium]
MKWLDKLIHPEEQSTTLLLVLFSFMFMGVPWIYTGTAAQTLFIVRYGADKLPLVYASLAIVIPLTGWIFLRLRMSFSVRTLLMLWIGGFAFMTLLVFGLVTLRVEKWTVFVALVWFEVEFVMGYLLYWELLVPKIFNVRQIKNLRPILETGEIIAIIMGGLSIPWLLKIMGTPYLFLLSFVGIMIGWGLSIYLLNSHQTQQIKIIKKVSYPSRTVRELFRDTYIQTVFAALSLSIIAYYLIDLSFFKRAQNQFIYPPDFAVFLAYFMASIGAVNLLYHVWTTKWPAQLNLFVKLAVLPISLVIGSGVVVFLGLLSAGENLIFVLICTIRFMERFLHSSLFKPSSEKLFEFLSPGDRDQTQTLAETIVIRFAAGLTGIVLIAVSYYFSLMVYALLTAALVISVLWLGGIYDLSKKYQKLLKESFQHHGIIDSELKDASNIQYLKEILPDSLPSQIVLILGALGNIKDPELESFLKHYLSHSDSDVRFEVIRLIQQFAVTGLLWDLESLLDTEPEPNVRGVILETMAILGDSTNMETFNKVLSALTDSSVHVKKGAFIGLLKSGGLTGAVAAGEKLNQLIVSANPSDRKFVCKILEKVGISGYYHTLLILLKDPDINVRKSAIRAAGTMGHEKLWPVVIDSLEIPALYHSATRALINGGKTVVPLLKERFYSPDQSEAMLSKLVFLFGKMQDEQSLRILVENFDYPDEDVRHHIYESLQKREYSLPRKKITEIQDRIKDEVEDAVWTLAAIRDIGDILSGKMLVNALRYEIRKNVERIFLLMSFIYPRQKIKSIFELYLSGKDNREVIHSLAVLLPKSLEKMLFPLLEELDDETRLTQLRAIFPTETLGREERLREIIQRSDQYTASWTKACALYMIGDMQLTHLGNDIVHALNANHDIQQETAIWALARCKPTALAEYVVPLLDNSTGLVFRMARDALEKITFMDYLRTPEYVAAYDSASVDWFVEILLDAAELKARRLKAAQALGSVSKRSQRELLLKGCSVTDGTIRSEILRALQRTPLLNLEIIREHLDSWIKVEINDLKLVLTAFKDLKTDGSMVELRRSLAKDVTYNRTRIFILLGIAEPDSRMRDWEFQSYRFPNISLSKTDKNDVAVVLRKYSDLTEFEWLEGVLLEFELDLLIKKMKQSFPKRQASQKWIRQIAFDTQNTFRSWTRSLALKHLVNEQQTDDIADIQQLARDSDSLIQETAIWGLSVLDPDLYKREMKEWAQSSSQHLIRLAIQISHEQEIPE